MLAALPLLAAGLLVGLAVRRTRTDAGPASRVGPRAASPAGPPAGVRIGVLRGVLLFGALVVASCEGLGALGRLDRAHVALFWSLVTLAAALAWLRLRRARRNAPGGPAFSSRLALSELVPLGALALVVAAEGATALLTSPNAHDVVCYHLPRVAQWAQQGSLATFPVHDLRQLIHPPFAELLDLSFYVLGGAERFAAPLRVLLLVASALAASVVAAGLGAGRRGQLAAAVLAATLPSVLVLSTAGKNGPVAGFLLLALAAFLLRLARGADRGDALWAGLALGLALFTKATSYLFAAPFVLACGALVLARHRRAALGPLALAAALAVLPNVGHTLRNLSLFGNPLGDVGAERRLLTERRDPRSIAVNAARHLSTQLVTPSATLNAGLEAGVRDVAAALGQDVDEPGAVLAQQSYAVPDTVTLSTRASNPLHLLLLLASLGVVGLRVARRRSVSAERALYALAILGGGLSCAALLRWSPHVSRLELPLMLLGMPLAATVLLAGTRRAPAVHALLLVAVGCALPFAVQASGLRLLGWRAERRLPREARLYQTTDYSLLEPARAAAAWLAERGCRRVGIVPEDPVFPDYALRVTLAARLPGLRLQHVRLPERLRFLEEREPFSRFEPDALLRVEARDPGEREPAPEHLVVLGRSFRRSFANERITLYAPDP